MASGRRVQITSERLAAAFDGMRLVVRRGQTDLVGEVVDQPHLYGVLARIRDLGLELGGVTFVPDSTVASTTNSEAHRP
jgi:hypothetical protein